MNAFGREVASRTLAGLLVVVIVGACTAAWATVSLIVPTLAQRYHVTGRELAAWLMVVALGAMIILAYRKERKWMPARVLEHYGMHLLWFRAIALRPESTEEELKSGRRWLKTAREELLNLTPSVFTQATADAFRAPSLLHVGKARELVSG
jgi:hypothetical protein